mgnify:CR=1 FL=1
MKNSPRKEEGLRERKRRETLHRIENQEGETAQLATVIARAIVHRHLATMLRLGITYDLLVRLAAEGAIRLEIRPVAEAEVRAAEEIWLSSSTKEVLAVTTLDGKPVGDGKPGPLFRRMHELFQEHKALVCRRGAVAA